MYRVSTQHHPGDEIVTRKIKAADLRELEEFVRRLCCVANCAELSIYEVVEDCVDTTTGELIQKWHVGNPNAKWPLNAKMRNDPMVYAPRVPSGMPREIPPPPQEIKDARPAIHSERMIMMPPVQNRRTLESSTEHTGAPTRTMFSNTEHQQPVLTNVREINRTLREKREEERRVLHEGERMRPMRRLTKKGSVTCRI